MLAKGLKVLVIGGGFSGMAAAIQLRKASADVELVEIDPGWRSYGAGISLQGAALRAFRTLGILDEFLKRGAGTDGVDALYRSRPSRSRSLPTPRLAGPDVPGGAPSCARSSPPFLRSDRGVGAAVRLGAPSPGSIDGAHGVRVRLTDGSRRRL